jgi:hypothetical protein
MIDWGAVIGIGLLVALGIAFFFAMAYASRTRITYKINCDCHRCHRTNEPASERGGEEAQ